MATHAEGALTKQVATWLKGLQAGGTPLFWEHRSGTGGFAYKQGLPDMFIVIGSTHVEVELKAPGGRKSPMQEKWEQRFSAMGVPYVCPQSLAELQEFLKPYLDPYAEPEAAQWEVEVHPNWGMSRANVVKCASFTDAHRLYDSVGLGGAGNVVRVALKKDGKVVSEKSLPSD